MGLVFIVLGMNHDLCEEVSSASERLQDSHDLL
jgi:hypothetical protein